MLNSHPKDVHQVAFDCFGIDSSLTRCLVNLKHEVFTVATDSGIVLSYAEARFFLQSFAGWSPNRYGKLGGGLGTRLAKLWIQPQFKICD